MQLQSKTETHCFNVRTGLLPNHGSKLILTPERIQLRDEQLLAQEVEWIRFRVTTMTTNGIKTGTTSELKLGNTQRKLSFSLHDMMYSSVRTETFEEIYSLVIRFYGSRIIDKMLKTLANRGSFNIGKIRFRADGVELPRRKFIFFSGNLELVPWLQIQCRFYEREVYLENSQDSSVGTSENLWNTDNACLIEPLVRIVRSSMSQ